MKFIALLAVATAAARPAATDRWLWVNDAATLCTHPGGQGQCVHFRAPGSQPVTGAGPRVFRLVAERGAEVEIQAQFDPNHAACGTLPSRITPLHLRLFVDARAVAPIARDASCLDPLAGQEPGPGRDPQRFADRVATVRAGAGVYWPDGSLAGQVRQELWLQDEHGLHVQGGLSCASFDIGPDDGGPSADRVLDVCFRPGDLTIP